MSIDLGTPYLPEEEAPKGDNIQRAEEQNRQFFLLGGAMGTMGGSMGTMGGYMGPVYPVLLEPEDKREEDPNP